jgi:predicted anti-sigma-YlaC factor YlaD
MKCDEWLQRLAEYKDGQLPASICDEIDQHVQECGPCAAIDRDLRDLQRMCRETPQPCLPEDARQRIENLLRRRDA